MTTKNLNFSRLFSKKSNLIQFTFIASPKKTRIVCLCHSTEHRKYNKLVFQEEKPKITTSESFPQVIFACEKWKTAEKVFAIKKGKEKKVLWRGHRTPHISHSKKKSYFKKLSAVIYLIKHKTSIKIIKMYKERKVFSFLNNIEGNYSWWEPGYK